MRCFQWDQTCLLAHGCVHVGDGKYLSRWCAVVDVLVGVSGEGGKSGGLDMLSASPHFCPSGISLLGVICLWAQIVSFVGQL